MSYHQKNITLIDDLPTLDDLEVPKSHGLNMIPESEVHKYQKFIRNSGHTTPYQSGMAPQPQPQLQPHTSNSVYAHQMNVPSQNMSNNYSMDHDNKHNMKDYASYNLNYNPYTSDKVYENFDVKPEPAQKKVRVKATNYGGNTCVDVAEHATSCSVCSRLYANNNTLLIIFLVISLIFNIMFIKKILET